MCSSGFSADNSTLVTVGTDGVLIRWSPFAAETAEEFTNRSG
jgi:hypothetical protein